MSAMKLCFAALAVLMATGCGDDDGPRMTDDAGTDSGPVMMDSGPRRDTGPAMDAGGGDDGNDSFAEAEALPLGPDGVNGVLQEPGDHDFFSFTGTAGAWMWISTEANPDDNTDMVDTVITLFDSSMTQIAENDDRQPRVNTDSEIIIRLPADGLYYIDVQEWSSWDPTATMEEGQPDYEYGLTAFEINTTAMGLVEDAETGDDAASATAVSFNEDTSVQFGTFRDDTDVDVFSFSMTAGQMFSSNIMPQGVDGYGATSSIGNAWITDMAGTTIIARVDNTMDFTELDPSLAAGDYLLWLEHPGGSAGANDFYVLKSFRQMDNPPEADEAGNNTLAGAEALTMMDVDGVNSGFILAMAIGDGTDGEVDYFSFPVMAGHQTSVACGSASSGSGVQDLLVEVRNDADVTVSMATESGNEGVFIEDARTTAAATYYLRLSKGGQDAEVTGNWVRCGIRSGMPASM